LKDLSLHQNVQITDKSGLDRVWVLPSYPLMGVGDSVPKGKAATQFNLLLRLHIKEAIPPHPYTPSLRA